MQKKNFNLKLFKLFDKQIDKKNSTLDVTEITTITTTEMTTKTTEKVGLERTLDFKILIY
jgi:hypothetical protein